ncbi:MAG: magnesium ABC transporter ATPase [Cyanobium sp. CACIAM 14]|nr:MAG: magnesium ABC transporter ATPase [Cyanobium sp. CACIAM 14]
MPSLNRHPAGSPVAAPASAAIESANQELLEAARRSPEEVLERLNSTADGLSELQSQLRLARVGPNLIAHEKPVSWVVQLLGTFRNPLVALLAALAAISLLTGDSKAAVIILAMILFSVILRFSQEYRSLRAAEALRRLVHTTATVLRHDARKDISPALAADLGLHLGGETPGPQEIPIDRLVPGDVVLLSAGDMIPADVRVLASRDLFVSQAALTGESLPVEKHAGLPERQTALREPLELQNLCFLGTNVISGSATAVVVETGERTCLGLLARTVTGVRSRTSFDRGISDISLLLVRFMVVMAPAVFVINGISKGNWGEAFFFALSVAVGLTPEMLPMIVTANLSRGAIAMAKEKVIVKNIDSIQNLGAMNILCTDKTGTLTQDRIVLKLHLDLHGRDCDEVLELAYLNSFYQTGLRSLLDVAVLEDVEMHAALKVEKNFRKIDEIPFDFQRRRMSVVVEEENHHHELICKGALEEILAVCSSVKDGPIIQPLDDDTRRQVLKLSEDLNDDGLRVIAVAYKEVPLQNLPYSLADESDLTLVGLIAFLDPPKDSAAEAIRELNRRRIAVKVLTGDNPVIARKTCRDVGLKVEGVLVGAEIEAMDEARLAGSVETTTIFAKLSPLQKSRIIRLLRARGHVVGFMGDGINDAAALREADIGISVDTAVDIAKESADIVLLEKSLLVLNAGVAEGRRTFGNIVKYIKMGTSSAFGNMFSMLGASIVLPFLPMLPVQILLNNLLYDFSQTGIPFDNVDPDYLEQPRQWSVADFRRFMIWIGPISSLFDYATFALMWFVFSANTVEQQALFHTGWFVESLMTQTLIVHIIRTARIPFLQSNPAPFMALVTVLVMAIGIALPFTSIGAALGMVALPAAYFGWLGAILLSYCVLTQLVKTWYVRRFGYN